MIATPNTAARHRAATWARRIVNDPDVVFVDTETTSLKDDAEIVDIAVLRFDGRVLLDSLCCPINRIPPESSAIHGITERHVHRSPMWKELFPKVQALLRDRVFVAWNAKFDVGVIRRLCAVSGLPDPIGQWQDAMAAYGDFDGTPNQWGNGMKWWKLGEAAERFGIEPGGHRAKSDAETCLKIVTCMAGWDNEPN